MKPYLINPADGRRRRKRRAPRKLGVVARAKRSVKRRVRTAKRKFSAAQLAAQQAFAERARERSTTARMARGAAGTINPRRKGGTMAKRKRKARANGTRRRRRRHASANPRRRRRTHHAAANPRRRRRRHTMANPRHRRRHRRNPGIGSSVKGIGGLLVQGVKDGFIVRLGGGLTKYVSGMVPIGTAGSPTQGAVQLVIGTGLSLAVKKFMGPRAASFFLAGAAADVIGTLIPSTIPVVGPILGGGALSAWPDAQAPRLAAYVPRPAAPPAQLGEYDYDYNPDGIYS